MKTFAEASVSVMQVQETAFYFLQSIIFHNENSLLPYLRPFRFFQVQETRTVSISNDSIRFHH